MGWAEDVDCTDDNGGCIEVIWLENEEDETGWEVNSTDDEVNCCEENWSVDWTGWVEDGNRVTWGEEISIGVTWGEEVSIGVIWGEDNNGVTWVENDRNGVTSVEDNSGVTWGEGDSNEVTWVEKDGNEAVSNGNGVACVEDGNRVVCGADEVASVEEDGNGVTSVKEDDRDGTDLVDGDGDTCVGDGGTDGEDSTDDASDVNWIDDWIVVDGRTGLGVNWTDDERREERTTDNDDDMVCCEVKGGDDDGTDDNETSEEKSIDGKDETVGTCEENWTDDVTGFEVDGKDDNGIIWELEVTGVDDEIGWGNSVDGDGSISEVKPCTDGDGVGWTVCEESGCNCEDDSGIAWVNWIDDDADLEGCIDVSWTRNEFEVKDTLNCVVNSRVTTACVVAADEGEWVAASIVVDSETNAFSGDVDVRTLLMSWLVVA